MCSEDAILPFGLFTLTTEVAVTELVEVAVVELSVGYH
jgi:hypothetical protein